MRPFDDLTARGQERRIGVLARRALERYGWASDASVSVAARSFNLVFRVRERRGTSAAASGRRGALRVGPRQRIHAEGTELVEAAWMAALRADTAVALPEVYRADHGAPVVWARHPAVPEDRVCMLFGWVSGGQLRDAMSPARARQLGTLSALLHDHGAATAPDAAPEVLVANRVLYWRLPDRLDELAPRYGALFRDALGRAQTALDALWKDPPHPPHLIHGDLNLSNVLVGRNRLVAIDFQDLVWGLEIQDLAITLRALSHFDDGAALAGCFRAGYEDERPWPDLDPTVVAAVMAGRWLHQLNLGLNMPWSGLDQMVLDIGRLVGAWMAGSTTVDLP